MVLPRYKVYEPQQQMAHQNIFIGAAVVVAFYARVINGRLVYLRPTQLEGIHACSVNTAKYT